MAWVAAPVNVSRCLQQWRGVELAPARHSLLACLSGIAFICRAMSTPTRLQARRDEFSASVDSRRRSYMHMHGCPEPWSLSQSTMHRQDKKWKTKHTPILFCVCVRMCVCGFEREKTRQSVEERKTSRQANINAEREADGLNSCPAPLPFQELTGPTVRETGCHGFTRGRLLERMMKFLLPQDVPLTATFSSS